MWTRRTFLELVAASVLLCLPRGAQEVAIVGELREWHRIALNFRGPLSSETAESNPFLDWRLVVQFEHAWTGETIDAHGFFAADGAAADTGASAGDIWRCYFVPPRQGPWTWIATFRQGPNIAISPAPSAGLPDLSIHGQSGELTILPSDKSAPDLRALGRRSYVDRHHLVHAESGARFLKAGANSPENFLAYHEFDGTWDVGGIPTPFLIDGLHEYAVHVADHDPLDPLDAAHTWGEQRGRGILGALNALSGYGVNSIYFLTFNVDGESSGAQGDGQDTWPWIANPGQAPSPQQRLRFDCSKLDQWERVFAHANARGLQLHLVLQETENDEVLDGGEMGLERSLYLHEMVARFSHHLSLQWNLGEENTNTDAQRIAMADFIASTDPYDHPIALHSLFDTAGTPLEPTSYYDGVFGHPNFHSASIQGFTFEYADYTLHVREQSALAGQPWLVSGDEQIPEVDPAFGNLLSLRRALWGNLVSGGAGCEWYVGYQNDFGDLQLEDFHLLAPLWVESRLAIDYFQDAVRYWEMEPANELVVAPRRCLARPDRAYLVYAQSGGFVQLDLSEATGSYAVEWFDPRTGAIVQGSTSSVNGGSEVQLGLPPYEVSSDWVVNVRLDSISYEGMGSPGSNLLVPALDPVQLPDAQGTPWQVEVRDLQAGQVCLLLFGAKQLDPPVPWGSGEIFLNPAGTTAPWVQQALADEQGVAHFDLPGLVPGPDEAPSLLLQALALDEDVDGEYAISQLLRIDP